MREQSLAVPSKGQWEKLYRLSEEIRDMAPWEHMGAADFILISGPEYEPVCCSILGQNGDCFGVAVYCGMEGIAHFLHMADTGPGARDQILYEQEYLVCYFGNREEIEKEDRAVIDELGLKFRGRNKWIYFREKETGCPPWFLKKANADMLIYVLRHVRRACKSLISGQVEVDFARGQVLTRLYSQEDRQWTTLPGPMPEFPPEPGEALVLEDDILLARLKRQPRLEARVELDALYLPLPLMDEVLDRPYYPVLGLAVDRDERQIYDNTLGPVELDRDQMAFEMLVNLIMSAGRPATVFVRDERIALGVEDICDKLDIPLQVGRHMPELESALDALFAQFGPDMA